MLYPVMRYFQWFSLPFPVFIIISMCAHSHGSVKHWWHSSQSIDGYMVTSTKIWYLGSFCSFYEIAVSVIWDITWSLYRLYFYWQIMSVIFYVVSCDMLSCLQHILNWSCWIFEHIWCVCCVTGELYINVHVYLYITMVFYTVNCICIIFHVFWCFNIHLFCAIVCNTDITYHIYHFNHKYMLFNFNFLFLQYNLYMST